MKIKSFTKKAVCVALLAGAAFGASATTVTPLGGAAVGVPLSFNGAVLPAGPFTDVFTFDLPVNGGSGYSVIAFDVPNPSVPGSFLFKTLLTTGALYTNPNGILYDADDGVVAAATNIGNSLSLAWGPLSAGHYYLTVGGTATGTLGGLYNGAISVTAPPIPEPESYAMFLAGLGLMGVIVRRRMRGQS